MPWINYIITVAFLSPLVEIGLDCFLCWVVLCMYKTSWEGVPKEDVLAFRLRVTVRGRSRHRPIEGYPSWELTLYYPFCDWYMAHCVAFVDVEAIDWARRVIVLGRAKGTRFCGGCQAVLPCDLREEAWVAEGTYVIKRTFGMWWDLTVAYICWFSHEIAICLVGCAWLVHGPVVVWGCTSRHLSIWYGFLWHWGEFYPQLCLYSFLRQKVLNKG